MSIYKQYRNRFIRVNTRRRQGYRNLLSNKDKFLIDFLLDLEASNIGFAMQIWNEFKKKNLDIKKGKSIKSFVEDEVFYRKNDIADLENKVELYFQSSFDNKYSKKLKALMLDRELMCIRPTNEGAVSLMDDYLINWQKEYKHKRKTEALKLHDKYKISKDKNILLLRVFNILLFLVNDRKQDDPYLKDVVILLERSIEKLLPEYFRDLDYDDAYITLTSLRKQVTEKYNTLCWQCGKQLYKKNSHHYCSRAENRTCYLARYKEERNSEFPSSILRTKNRCDKCGAMASLDHIHKVRGVEMQFCSVRCWEAYRKTVYRKNIKVSQK